MSAGLLSVGSVAATEPAGAQTEGYDRIVVLQHSQINTIDAYDPVQSAPPPE